MCKRRTPFPKTHTEAVAYICAVATMDDAEPCEHGHLSCATEQGGPCLDEVMSTFPDAEA